MDKELAEYVEHRIDLLKSVIADRNTPGIEASATEVAAWQARLAELEALKFYWLA